MIERPLFTRLVVHGPSGYLYVGPEPEQSMTRRGAVLFLLTPILCIIVALSVMPVPPTFPPIVYVALATVIAIVIYIGIRLYWDEQAPLPDRSVDYAWEKMVPALRKAEIQKNNMQFLAGLALVSQKHGTPEDRRLEIDRLAEAAESMEDLRPLSSCFYVLQLNDLRQQGADYLPRMAELVGEAFSRTLALEVVERILHDFPIELRDRAVRARFRILLLTYAFEAKLEADDLRELGRSIPALGAVYASEDRTGLARLRLLWMYRHRRLWQKVGSATSVFDIARFPTLAGIYLKARPDLLLFQPTAGNTSDSAPILICEEGIVYRESILKDTRTRMEVVPRSKLMGGGYELKIGDARYPFREDPSLLVKRLKAWAAFLFDEFLPQARLIRDRQSAQLDRLLVSKLVECPECKRHFLGITGDLGRPSVRGSLAGRDE